MKFKGWIALDIDGTITLDKYSVPLEVRSYLSSLAKEGWRIALATGRPFAFAQMALSEFDFPYVFLAQNGSIAIEMPNRKVIFKKYILPNEIPLFERSYSGVDSDFLIYAGYEKGDFCYWRPNRFCQDDLQYLNDLQKRQKESWRSIDEFDSTHLDPFPLVKCFGSKERMQLISSRLNQTGKFQVTLIKDPHSETNYHLLLVTDKTASKGASLTDIFELKGRGERVIAAGDDENDISLLQVADTKIAMAHAPETVQQIATFIAPPTKENGIIQALQMALK